MFNDRDLTILGIGALAAIACLFLPFSFAIKIILGTLVLALFMALALVRFGRDRVSLEVWLRRRIKYAMTPRQHVYHQRDNAAPVAAAPAPEAKQASQQTGQPEAQPDYADLKPVRAAWDEIGVYPLVTAFLVVVGAYFVYWLAVGGAKELSIFFT